MKSKKNLSHVGDCVTVFQLRGCRRVLVWRYSRPAESEITSVNSVYVGEYKRVLNGGKQGWLCLAVHSLERSLDNSLSVFREDSRTQADVN